jgi:hypothetical protein
MKGTERSKVASMKSALEFGLCTWCVTHAVDDPRVLHKHRQLLKRPTLVPNQSLAPIRQ